MLQLALSIVLLFALCWHFANKYMDEYDILMINYGNTCSLQYQLLSNSRS